MPPVAAVGAFVVGAASAVASVAVAVVSTIAAVVAPVVAAVTTVISAVVATIGPVLTSVIEAVGGIVEGISGALQGAVNFIRTAIAEPFANIVKALKTGITDLAKAITEPLKPILNPIKDALVSIKDFVADTATWIETQLVPVKELKELIDTISFLVVVKMLLEGTTSISQVIGDVAEESGLKTAQAITVLWRETVQMGTGIMENVRDHYTIVTDTINDTDDRLRKDIKLALEYTSETLEGEAREISDALSKRLLPLEYRIASIERRAMDLPFFQQMLIRALD